MLFSHVPSMMAALLGCNARRFPCSRVVVSSLMKVRYAHVAKARRPQEMLRAAHAPTRRAPAQPPRAPHRLRAAGPAA
jgi:hypothetical protein